MRLIKSMHSLLRKQEASAESRDMVGISIQICICYSPPAMVHQVDVGKMQSNLRIRDLPGRKLGDCRFSMDVILLPQIIVHLHSYMRHKYFPQGKAAKSVAEKNPVKLSLWWRPERR